jgi:hypothetical protein
VVKDNWKKWIYSKMNDQNVSKVEKEAIFFKKIRSLKYLEHIKEKKMELEEQQELNRRKKVHRRAGAAMTLLEWFNTIKNDNPW